MFCSKKLGNKKPAVRESEFIAKIGMGESFRVLLSESKCGKLKMDAVTKLPSVCVHVCERTQIWIKYFYSNES